MLTEMCIGEGEEVGTIQLTDWPSAQYRSPEWTQELTQQSNLSIVKLSSNLSALPKTTNTTAENAQDPELTVRITLTRTILSPLDVFLLIIAVMVEAAEMGAQRLLQNYASPTDVSPVWIIFEEPIPARVSPPFFEVRWLMMIMTRIPEYMIRKGIFQEALVMVEVDGVSVADGFLMVRDAPVPRMNVNSTISVS